MTGRTSQRVPWGRSGLILAGLVLSAVGLTACKDNQYIGRRDSVTLGVGDAVATNKLVHTIDPWPRYSKNKNFGTDGKRMMVGVKRYQENKSLEPEGTDTTERFENDDAPDSPPPGGPPASH